MNYMTNKVEQEVFDSIPKEEIKIEIDAVKFRINVMYSKKNLEDYWYGKRMIDGTEEITFEEFINNYFTDKFNEDLLRFNYIPIATNLFKIIISPLENYLEIESEIIAFKNKYK